jgi:uncharacterized SAM-binding protein YcdF (DUF218 family)
MTYYVFKVFWLIGSPTSALVLTTAIAALGAALGSSKFAAWLAAAAACGLVIAGFTPIGVALTRPLEYRFPFSRSEAQAPPDGIIVLGGAGNAGIETVTTLSRDYPKARIVFSGFHPDRTLTRFARLGGDPSRVYVESRARTTFEDSVYAAALLTPKPGERWLLVTVASHMPRAVGCFRVTGFDVKPYPVAFQSGFFGLGGTSSEALYQLDTAAKEWIGLLAYRLMGRTDALFPGP